MATKIPIDRKISDCDALPSSPCPDPSVIALVVADWQESRRRLFHRRLGIPDATRVPISIVNETTIDRRSGYVRRLFREIWLLISLTTLVSCIPLDKSSNDVIADGCSVTASIAGQDLVATARYRCIVPLLKAYLAARVDVESGVFEFGRHTQYVECGPSIVEITERYLMPPGVQSASAYASAGFREGAINCDSRDR